MGFTCVEDVRLFKHAEVKCGERWIYSADFNVKDVVKPYRVDEEINDIRKISDAGGIAVVLANEGRYGNTRSLEFVANYMAEALRRDVHYFPENTNDAALDFVKKMTPGEIVILGNTRFNYGEDKNDSVLAKIFSIFGDFAVIGGFGKAHRKHASNYGILDHCKGYLSTSQEEQMNKIEPWSGKKDKYSVAVLGGIKGEKITDGLVGFAEIYDTIIPGGIVLNTILKCMGKQVGLSVLKDGENSFESEVREVLEKYPIEENPTEKRPNKIIVPKEVVVAWPDEKGFGYVGKVNLAIESIPEDSMVVGYTMPFDGQCALARVAQEKGRLVVAGTPDISSIKESSASYQLNYFLPQIGKNALILGGDTARDLDAKDAVISTGGGSALMYLTVGTTHVYEKLKENYGGV